ncbi:outer membrane lipoprotein-sorting protein [Magnetovibrio sp. PR-2]|uniref:outer membrane lipoprotein-sorting protein n=1 Tax=Magnetovibrio sp. PR-2 TaxID=3120356 RepID=UPI002FCE43A4
MLKAIQTLFSVTALAAMTFSALPTQAEELTGRQIMDKVSDIHDRPYEFESQEMLLIDRQGGEEKREVRRYTHDFGEGEKKYLVSFLAPQGVRGVALLTWQHKVEEDEQFLYLPSQGKKMKRIAKSGKRNYFMGTDLTFEDLISETRDKFDYKRQEDAEREGKPVYVIDAYPMDEKLKRSTGYQYRRLFVQKDISFIVETEYYDRRGRFIKRQLSQDLEDIGDGGLRAKTQIIDNESKKHKTITTVYDRSFEKSLVDKKIFRQRYITSGKHVR